MVGLIAIFSEISTWNLSESKHLDPTGHDNIESVNYGCCYDTAF